MIRLPAGSLHTEASPMDTQRSIGSVQVVRHNHPNRPSIVRFLPPRAKGVLAAFVIADDHLDDFIRVIDQMKVSLLAARAEAATREPTQEIVKWKATPEWRAGKVSERVEELERLGSNRPILDIVDRKCAVLP